MLSFPSMPKVKFVREKKEVEVAEGANLRLAALAHGVNLYPGVHEWLNCRGFGQCGKCAVLLERGAETNVSTPTLLERLRLGGSLFQIGFEEKMRLACQTQVLGDVEVTTQPRPVTPAKLASPRGTV
jgi:ferredoxin